MRSKQLFRFFSFLLFYLCFIPHAFAADPGTCHAIAVPKNRSAELETKIDQNKCSQGYQAQAGINNDRSASCTCIANNTNIECSTKNVQCNGSNSACNSAPGCGNYVCSGEQTSKGFIGRCIDKAEIPTPTQKTPETSSTNGTTTNDGKVDMFEFKSPSYLPQYSNRYKILNNILSLVLSFISVISTGFLVWGGIQFITSEGDKQKVQAARGRITYAILGLIIAFLSFLIVQLIGYVFDLQSTGRTILDITL